MNRENIKRVRDHIAGLPPERFGMDVYLGHHKTPGVGAVQLSGLPAETILHDCGTCGCIAGWTAALLAPRAEYSDVRPKAQVALGLNRNDAHDLFLPQPIDNWGDVTPAQAVAVLDHLLETGEVDWSVAEKVAAS